MSKKDWHGGSWIQTYSGRVFDYVTPGGDDIAIEDIAVQLSRIPRFAGATLAAYSVGQHSLYVANWVEACGGSVREQLAGLLHDATEAYLLDMPKPVKALLPDYQKLEQAVWDRIATRFFGGPMELPAIVKDADQALLIAEAYDLFASPHNDWPAGRGARCPWRIKPCGESIVRWAFLESFERLTKTRGAVAA